MPFPQRVWLLFGSLSPSKFGDKISSLADLGCLSRILNPESERFPSRSQDTGSKFFPSWIPDPRFEFFPSQVLDPGCISKNLSILTKKMVTQLSEIWSRFSIPDPDPGSGSWLFTYPRSRIQGSKRQRIPDPGSRIRIRNTGDFGFAQAVTGWHRLLTFNGRCCLKNSFNGSAEQLSEAFMCIK